MYLFHYESISGVVMFVESQANMVKDKCYKLLEDKTKSDSGLGGHGWVWKTYCRLNFIAQYYL